MPNLLFTNNSGSTALLFDPADTSNGYRILPGSTLNRSVEAEFLNAIKDQLDAYASRFDEAGDPEFVIDVTFDSDEAGEYDFALSDTTLWIANHVGYDVEVSAPSSASVVSARRIDHNAGEAYVDGAFFRIAAAADVTGDGEVDKDGADVSAVDLVASEDVYMHVLLVNNAGSLEILFVRGDSAATGEAELLTRDQLAIATGTYLGLSTAEYAYVEIARVLYEESGGLTETVTDYRAVPASYG